MGSSLIGPTLHNKLEDIAGRKFAQCRVADHYIALCWFWNEGSKIWDADYINYKTNEVEAAVRGGIHMKLNVPMSYRTADVHEAERE